MQWSEVRESYPKQWLVIEALEAHTNPENQRMLENIAVIGSYGDGNEAMCSYRQLHMQFPTREFYYVHTDRLELDIHERRWAGIRRNDAIGIER